MANESGPSGWTGAVAEVDSRVCGVDTKAGADEVTTGDAVLFGVAAPWSVGDVHAVNSMTMAVPHMTRWSAMFWRLRLCASDGWGNCYTSTDPGRTLCMLGVQSPCERSVTGLLSRKTPGHVIMNGATGEAAVTPRKCAMQMRTLAKTQCSAPARPGFVSIRLPKTLAASYCGRD